jgi:recombination protein RecT
MSAQTVTQAVAQRDTTPSAMVAKHLDDFASVLPTHVKPATFVRLAQGVLRRDEALAAAAQRNPASLMASLLDCARLGHDPGTEAYWLIPFGGEVTGIEGYRGKIERIYRAGAVSVVKAEVVRVNDHYLFDQQTMDIPEHRFDDFASDEERGELRGVYVYGVMKDGAISRCVRMGRAEVMKHKAMAKGTNRPDSPWVKWEPSMWLRCGVGELEKWVPSSTEYRREQLRAAAVVAGEQQTGKPERTTTPAVDVLDGELVDPEDWPETREPGGES